MFYKTAVAQTINHVRGWKCVGCHNRNAQTLDTCTVCALGLRALCVCE